MNALVPTCPNCVTAYEQAPVWRRDEPHMQPSCIPHWVCKQRKHGFCGTPEEHREKMHREDSVFVASVKVMLAALPDAFAYAKQVHQDKEVGQLRLDAAVA